MEPMTDLAEIRAAQIEEHHGLALRYADRVRAIDLTDVTYSAPPSDDVRTWPPVLRWAAYEQRYTYHADVCTHLERGKGPFYCAMCSPLRDRPKGYKLLPCWPCWWDAHGYDAALDKARALSKTRLVGPFLRPTEV